MEENGLSKFGARKPAESSYSSESDEQEADDGDPDEVT
jgi:hypothetical protein